MSRSIIAFAFLLVASMLAFALPSAAQAEVKIGFVNQERILRESAPAKRAQQKLEKEFATRKAGKTRP
jgi:outer membrane protein